MNEAQPLAERVRHAYARWHESRGETADLFLDMMADDIEMRSVLDPPELDPLAEDRDGIDRAREYMDEVAASWDMIEYPTEQVLADGDTVVWIGRCHWRNRKTGREIQSRKIDVWRFRDGKAVGFLEMYDTLGFAKVAGLL